MLQYENSPRLNKLINGIVDRLAIDIDVFIKDYWNIATAKKDGLDNWGRILNVSRSVEVTTLSEDIFGFDTGEKHKIPMYPETLNNGVFYYEASSHIIDLEDDPYRAYLIFTYLKSISNASIANINYILRRYFNKRIDKDNLAYCYESAPMEVTYVFTLQLEAWERTLFYLLNALPKPSGVMLKIREG